MTAKKTPTTAAAKTSTAKAATKKPTKVAVAKAVKASKNGKATDGTLRGVAKPANWTPPTKQLSYDEIKEQCKGRGLRNHSGIRKPQATILTLLSKARAPMNRAMIAEQTGIDNSWVGDWIGYLDADKRAEQEAKWGRTSLLTKGFVKFKKLTVPDAQPETVYEITPAGRKELETYNKMVAEKEANDTAEEKARAQREKDRAAKKAAAEKAK